MENADVHARLARLERRLRVHQTASVLALLAAVGWACAGLRAQGAGDGGRVLRVRGIVVEDAAGRPRLLLGAPAPQVAERRRKHPAYGLVVLGENGQDRVVVGAPMPGPQIGGREVERIGAGAGIQLNDTSGNERGGFSTFPNGAVVLGLDYERGEAVSLSVQPSGMAGLLVHGERARERAGIVVNNPTGVISMKLADTTGREGIIWQVRADSTPTLRVRDPATRRLVDLTPRLRP